MQFALRTVAEAATRKSSSLGLQLLRDGAWEGAHFNTGLRGYTAGMTGDTDWMKVRSDLLEIVDERVAERTGSVQAGMLERGERGEVDFAVARQWADRDLDSAMEWFMNEAQVNTRTVDRPMAILTALSDRVRAATWLESHLDSGEATVDLVASYAQRIAHYQVDEAAERLVQIPERESDRARVLSPFLQTVEMNGTKFLRHPPESLQRLVEAAGVGEIERARLMEHIATTPFPTSR